MPERLQQSGANVTPAGPLRDVDAQGPRSEQHLLKALHGLAQLNQGYCLTEVHFISLSRIQDILGNTWAKLRQRILPMVQQWLEAELGGGDTVFILGDGFCILYAQLRGREADAKSEALEKMLSSKLFGSGEQEPQGMASGPGSAAPPVANDSGSEAPVETNANTSIALRSPSRGPEIEAKKPEVSEAFLPLWSPSRQAVNVFSCVPARIPPNRAHYYDPPEEGPDLDRTLLNAALENILELQGSGETSFVISSFNFNSINRQKNRRPYELMFREIPKELRGYFIARIVRLPPGTPSMSIPPAVVFLRAFFSRVFIHVSLGEHDLTAYGSGGLGGAGVSLRGLKANGDSGLPDVHSLARFVATTRRLKMPAYVEGVTTPSELALCRDAGFDLIGGGLIAWPLKKLVPAYKIDEAALISGRDGREWIVE